MKRPRFKYRFRQYGIQGPIYVIQRKKLFFWDSVGHYVVNVLDEQVFVSYTDSNKDNLLLKVVLELFDTFPSHVEMIEYPTLIIKDL